MNPSSRGANGSRECVPDDRLRDGAIQNFMMTGLLRLYARFHSYDAVSELINTNIRPKECSWQIRDGIAIRAVDDGNRIITGNPTNVPRNP